MSELVLDLAIERVRYGAHVALRDVRLSVARGEIVGVAGHVGAGKTTLALAAAGLLARATRATIEGRVIHPAGSAPPASYVFANPWTQLTELGGTVEEEVAVGPENQALEASLIRARVDAALATAGAGRLATRNPRELSGGEVQRVALASALALDAPLVVLDEPTAQLDYPGAMGLTTAIHALAKSGRGVLLVEQNLMLLMTTADRVIVLADGAILEEGEPMNVLAREPAIDARLGTVSAGLAVRHVDRPERGDAVLEVRGLSAGYGDRAVLTNASLRVARGEIVAWMGENGAGKTTFARAVMGLVPARGGTVLVNGVALDALPVEQRARHVGLVFQDPSAQLFGRTVRDEVLFGPSALGLPRSDALASAHEALDAVGLTDQAETNPADLTPQAQRRLAIAAAMASRPPMLILDEPTAGQDAAGRDWIARALALQAGRGAAAVITHDVEFAAVRCTTSVTFAKGQVSNIRAHSP